MTQLSTLVGKFGRNSLLAGGMLLMTATGSVGAQQGTNGYGDMMNGSWGLFGSGMFVWPLLLVGIVALAIYWAGNPGETPTTEKPDPARAELRERYARGDIDDEVFENRLQRLSENR